MLKNVCNLKMWLIEYAGNVIGKAAGLAPEHRSCSHVIILACSRRQCLLNTIQTHKLVVDIYIYMYIFIWVESKVLLMIYLPY